MDVPQTVTFKHRNHATEPVIEFRGEFYHQYTPKKLFDGPYEELKPYRWVVNDRFKNNPEKAGYIKFRCPFHEGHLCNRQFASYTNANPGAVHVIIPKSAKRCCGGDIIVPPKELGKYQTPAYGSKAHKKITGIRNPVEGEFGNVKVEGGFDYKSCRAKYDEAPALAAVYAQVNYNLQLTMNDEIEELRAARKEARDVKQSRRADEASRKAEQDPADGSERVEPDGRDTDEEASDEDDESSSEAGAPSRAPP